MKIANIEKGKAVSVEIECYGAPNPTSSDTVVGYDGSLGADGKEVKITGQRTDKMWLPDLDSVKGCAVDTSCGLHVHIDVRDLNYAQVRAVYGTLVKFSNSLKRLCPESRQTNRYCRWRRNDNGRSRYSAINFTAFLKYQTIEFRCQAGSTEPEKITYWAELCWQLVQWARNRVVQQDGQYLPGLAPKAWLKFLRVLTPDVANWAAYRYAKLWKPDVANAIDAKKAGMPLTVEQEQAIREAGYSFTARRELTATRNTGRTTQRLFGMGVGRVLISATRSGLNFTQLSAALQRKGVAVSAAYIRRHMELASSRNTNCLSDEQLNDLRGA